MRSSPGRNLSTVNATLAVLRASCGSFFFIFLRELTLIEKNVAGLLALLAEHGKSGIDGGELIRKVCGISTEGQ